jgi:hypothetical protein
MSIEDHASLVSIRAQIAHLSEVQSHLPALHLLPPAARPAAIDAMVAISREMKDLTREARRLERALRADDQSRQP